MSPPTLHKPHTNPNQLHHLGIATQDIPAGTTILIETAVAYIQANPTPPPTPSPLQSQLYEISTDCQVQLELIQLIHQLITSNNKLPNLQSHRKHFDKPWLTVVEQAAERLLVLFPDSQFTVDETVELACK